MFFNPRTSSWRPPSLVVIGTVVLLAVTVSSCTDRQEAVLNTGAPGAAVEHVTLEFQTPVSLDELQQISSSRGLKVEEIRLVYPEFTSGYTVEGRDLGSVREDLISQHEQFLRVLASQELNDDPLSVSLRDARSRAVTLLSSDFSREIKVSIVTFDGQLDEDLESTLGAKVRDDLIGFAGESGSADSPRHGSELNLEPKSLWHESWAPYAGTTVVPGGYTYNTFFFNNTSRLKTDFATYEHETQIYNGNFANYGGYWCTNMPNGYKDTSFGDSIDNFTVGCSRAENLAANTRYLTYMSLTRGSAASATCRIKGQIGQRRPSFCTSPWCIWPVATSGTMAYLTLPNNGYSWQY